MAVLTSYEGANDDYENGGTNGYRGQSFKVPSNSSVTSISIYGSRGNTYSGTTTVSIWATSLTGTELGSKTVNTSTLTAYGSPAWNEITFDTPINLTGAVQYYLKVATSTGSAADELRWSTDVGGTYADGASWYATTGDTGWTENTGREKNFRISGTVSATNSSFFMFF